MMLKRRRRARTEPLPSSGIRLGAARGGDLSGWVTDGQVVYPEDVLSRHLVVIGATGSGKTETVLRIAHGAVTELGWRVYYIDAKGDPRSMHRFAATMRAAGCQRVKLFPSESYDGWRGDPLALLNRLMAVEDFSEPYYRAATKALLLDAVTSPVGPPRRSAELLERLASHSSREGKGAWARYQAFFGVLDGQLDGGWAYEDADAAYLLLDGVSLKEEAAGLGRYLVEDFAHFVAQRKTPEARGVYFECPAAYGRAARNSGGLPHTGRPEGAWAPPWLPFSG